MKVVNDKIDKEKLKTVLSAERAAALGSAQSSDLSEQRIKAYDYYMGDMTADMPAPDGQSSAVSTDVQDVVEGVLPIILDVLISGERVAEFKPTKPGDEAAADQETDFVNHVFYEENNGFLVLYSAIKDALLQKNGFVKWWVEEDVARTRESYKGLTADAYAMLVADDELEVVDSEEYDAPQAGQPPVLPGAEPPPPDKFYNVIVETKKTTKLRKVAAVPPEELLISKAATNIYDTPYMAHVMKKPQADAIELFPDFEEEIRAAPAAVTSSDNFESAIRQTVQDSLDQQTTAGDVNQDMRMIELVEHYARLPLEKDGVARRYKITTIGTKSEILDIEEVASWPFASGTPIIMPHRLFGRSLADLVTDVQEVKTSLMRATLNNAYFANNQRTEVSETHSNENTLDDLLNNRVGGIVRTKMPGGLKTIETQPIGHWVLPAIEYMDTVRENRTGISKYNQGLDADSLNHTATGITRIMDASEMRVKLMARIFAETLIVDIFRGLHELCQQYSEEKEVFRLRGQWTTVDPREWSTRRHMKVTIPLGGASKQQMLGFFSQMLGIQKEALSTPATAAMVTPTNLFNTVEQMTRLAGLSSVEPFFTKPNPNAPPPPAPPNPEMVKAQAQAQATAATQQADQQQAQQKAIADQNASQAKFSFEQQQAQAKMANEHARDQQQFEHKRALDVMKFNHEAEMSKIKLTHDLALSAAKAEEEAKLNSQQAKLDRTTDSAV